MESPASEGGSRSGTLPPSSSVLPIRYQTERRSVRSAIASQSFGSARNRNSSSRSRSMAASRLAPTWRFGIETGRPDTSEWHPRQLHRTRGGVGPVRQRGVRSLTGLEQLWYIATVVSGALASLLLRFGLVDCPADGEAALGCILLTSLFFIPLDGFVIGLLVDGGGRADLRAAGREQRRQLVCEAPFREHGAAAARRHRVHL